MRLQSIYFSIYYLKRVWNCHHPHIYLKVSNSSQFDVRQERWFVVQSGYFKCHLFHHSVYWWKLKRLDLIKHFQNTLCIWFADWNCCHYHCISEEARVLFWSYSTIEKMVAQDGVGTFLLCTKHSFWSEPNHMNYHITSFWQHTTRVCQNVSVSILLQCS